MKKETKKRPSTAKTVVVQELPLYTIKEFKKELDKGAVVLDTRPAQLFARGHVPGSINVGLDGPFAYWVAAVVRPYDAPVLLVCPKGEEKEVVKRLARIGFSKAIGFLKGGFENWKSRHQDIATISTISPMGFGAELKEPGITCIDVRRSDEYIDEHVEDALFYPLSLIHNNLKRVSPSWNCYLYDSTGYRAMVAASVLKRAGYDRLTVVLGHFQEFKKANVVCKNGICSYAA